MGLEPARGSLDSEESEKPRGESAELPRDMTKDTTRNGAQHRRIQLGAG